MPSLEHWDILVIAIFLIGLSSIFQLYMAVQPEAGGTLTTLLGQEAALAFLATEEASASLCPLDI